MNRGEAIGLDQQRFGAAFHEPGEGGRARHVAPHPFARIAEDAEALARAASAVFALAAEDGHVILREPFD